MRSPIEQNGTMRSPGARRRQLDEALRVAYGHGLLSERTFAYRIDRLLSAPTIDPRQLIGDLTPGRREGPRAVYGRLRAAIATRGDRRHASLLALDWDRPAADRLLVGRGAEADVVLENLTVSRRHAELLWRSGGWILHDLDSRNGTLVNGRPASRAQIRPGDLVRFGDQALRVD